MAEASLSRKGCGAQLSKSECGVSEQVKDAQKFGKGSALRIVGLCGHQRVADALVFSGKDLRQQRLVEDLSRPVETEAARRERGDGPLAFGLDQLLRERVEVGEVEVSVQTVQRQDERLLRLRGQRRDPRVVEDVLVRPEMDPAVDRCSSTSARNRSAALRLVIISRGDRRSQAACLPRAERRPPKLLFRRGNRGRPSPGVAREVLGPRSL